MKDGTGNGNAENPEAPLRERRSLRARRFATGAAVAALAVWFGWYPRNPDDIFRALPDSTAVAAYVRGMASEENAALKHPAVREAIAAFGADPDETLEDSSGLYWTLFWLTGEKSCLGIVPKSGECAGLGVYLAGASYTGWKARVLELLWRIKWVPGLGRLKTTAHGTRYMEFPHARELRDNGIVLGLDIVRGVLVAVLAQDPDLVRELSMRLSDGRNAPFARCFAPVGGTAGDLPDVPSPWKRIPKRTRLWIDLGAASDAIAATASGADLSPESGAAFADAIGVDAAAMRPQGTATVDLESFSKPGSDAAVEFASATLSAALPQAARPLPPPPDGEGVFASVSFSPASAPGAGSAFVAGAPNATRVAIVQVPSFAACVPVGSDFPALDAWWPQWFSNLKSRLGAFGKSFRDKAPSPDVRLVRSKALEALGRTPDADCAFVDAGIPGKLAFGLGWKAWQNVGRAGSGSAGNPPPAADGTLAALRVDFPRLCDEGRAMLAMTRLAGAFGLKMSPDDAKALDVVSRVLGAARGLGDAVVSLRRAEGGADVFCAAFRATPAPPPTESGASGEQE